MDYNLLPNLDIWDIFQGCIKHFCYLGDINNNGGCMEVHSVASKMWAGKLQRITTVRLLIAKRTFCVTRGKAVYSICKNCDAVWQWTLGNQEKYKRTNLQFNWNENDDGCLMRLPLQSYETELVTESISKVVRRLKPRLHVLQTCVGNTALTR